MDKSSKKLKYIIIIAIVAVLAVILICYGLSLKKTDKKSAKDEVPVATGSSVATGDAVEEESQGFYSNTDITELITKYMTAYADGKVKEIKKIKTPFKKKERQMIKTFSEYVDHYDNIKCYVKDGVYENTYMVSCSYDCYFKGFDTAVPGLQTFYIGVNEDGEYYIDGRADDDYSAEEQAYYLSYGEAADVKSLVSDVNQRYTEALESNAELNTLVKETIPTVLSSGDGQETASADESGEEGTDAAADTSQTDTEQPAVTQEIVYATDDVRVRAAAGEDAEQIGSAVKGDSFVREESLESGWSKIQYNGQTAYIKSDYLTTEQVIHDEQPAVTVEPDAVDESEATVTSKYHQEGQKITVHDALNIRESMSSDAKILTTTSDGDVVTVVLDYEEGWTKVTFGEVIGYIKTEYLD